ncbi:hypothetical protein SAMN04487911_11652 [Arenibacter nanhaiticus]|uniref:Secreted protein n=1 Tax=Arenibacter nanhaiticus TaxID=558155 RepID=A0A1M6I645_9FLAO|nr:hypothetical protein [Arenibacter nanhaiticus]SHJ29919.1 hypothetical protein SAMN04487911_11652 [Arenibacter nanhaiticus]
MRVVYLFVLLCLVSYSGLAQTDLPTTQPLKIEGDRGVKENPKQGTALKLPAIIDLKPTTNLRDSLTARQINMLPTRNLVQAGHDLKLDPKIREKEKEGSKTFFGDMYLGDIKSNGKFVGILCRDHEYVDGDRVRILLNDVVVEPNIFLTAAFKGLNLDLKKGFNRIDFEALNQGTSGPNTAQVDVYDDQGKLIHSNMWNLSTGSKATIIVIKE